MAPLTSALRRLALLLAAAAALDCHARAAAEPAGQTPPARPAPIAQAEPGQPQCDADGYWQVDFAFLTSFAYGHLRPNPEEEFDAAPRPSRSLLRPDTSRIIDPPTEPGTGGKIPDNVLAFDGRRVRVAGYMLPIKIEEGLVRQFLILRSQMLCCFGQPPAPNEWIVVRLKAPGIPSQMDTPLYFYGTLRVGEMFENGVFTGLYDLELDKISDP